MAQRVTLNAINNAVSNLGVELVANRAEGYFYVVGTRDETTAALSVLPSTSIFTPRLSDQPLHTWISDIATIVVDAHDAYRSQNLYAE